MVLSNNNTVKFCRQFYMEIFNKAIPAFVDQLLSLEICRATKTH